jgi:hypothetical protein
MGHPMARKKTDFPKTEYRPGCGGSIDDLWRWATITEQAQGLSASEARALHEITEMQKNGREDGDNV